MVLHNSLSGNQLHNPKGIQYSEDVSGFNSSTWTDSGLKWNGSNFVVSELGGTDASGNTALTWLNNSGSKYNTSYDHSQDNTQAHSDYLLNSGDDSTSGVITAGGFYTTSHVSSSTISGGHIATGYTPVAGTDVLNKTYGDANYSSVGKPQSHFTIRKVGSNYVGYNPTGGTIITNSNFCTTCQEVVNHLHYSGSSYLYIENPGSAIMIDSTITISSNGVTAKDAIIDGGMSEFDFKAFNGVCFDFYGYSLRERYMAIRNCNLDGDNTDTSEIFAQFTDVRCYADNLSTDNNRECYTAVKVIGACYLSKLENLFIHGEYPIVVEKYDDGVAYEANGTEIKNCNLGYKSSGIAISISGGIGLKINNIWIEECAIGLSGCGTYELSIENSYIGNQISGYNIYLDGTYSNISNNYFYCNNNNVEAISLHNYYGGNITNNRFWANAGKSGVTFVDVTSTNNLICNTNNMYFAGTPSGCCGLKASSYYRNGSICNNIIYSDNPVVGSDSLAAIDIGDGDYTVINNNTIRNFTKGIDIGTGTNSIVKNNIGHVTENSGWDVVADGGTIAHGCASKPSNVIVTPSGTTAFAVATTVDATNITVNHTGIGSQTVGWRAEV